MNNRASAFIKPYLKKFILQTHPDFFHYEKIKKQTNATSLQKLYNIFQPKVSKQPSSCTLQFFVKQTKQPVTIQFDSNDTEWDHAYLFLSLCQKLNISILQSDLEAIQNELNKKQKRAPVKSLTQEFADQLYQQRNIKSEWTTNDLLNNPLVSFDPSIKDKKSSASRLCQYLNHLKPELWWNKVPLLIISSKNDIPKELTKDILVIRDNMGLKGTRLYCYKESKAN